MLEILNVPCHGAERTLASWEARFWVVWEALARASHSIGNGLTGVIVLIKKRQTNFTGK